MWFLKNFQANRVCCSIFKRQRVVAHFVEHAAKSPNIDLAGSRSPPTINLLWRLHMRIVNVLSNIPRADDSRILDIANLDITLFREENFLCVETAVNEALIGEIADATGNLYEDPPLLPDRHNLIFFLIFFDPRHQICFRFFVDDVQFVILFKIVVVAQDMLMMQVLHYNRLLACQIYFFSPHSPEF